jgi:hypothetical protein
MFIRTLTFSFLTLRIATKVNTGSTFWGKGRLMSADIEMAVEFIARFELHETMKDILILILTKKFTK